MQLVLPETGHQAPEPARWLLRCSPPVKKIIGDIFCPGQVSSRDLPVCSKYFGLVNQRLQV